MMKHFGNCDGWILELSWCRSCRRIDDAITYCVRVSVCVVRKARSTSRLGKYHAQFRDAVLQGCSGEAPSHEPRQRKDRLGRAVGARLDLVRLVKHNPVPSHAVQNRALGKRVAMRMDSVGVSTIRCH
jgi:hypothetical protein